MSTAPSQVDNATETTNNEKSTLRWWHRINPVVVWPNWRTMGLIALTYLGAAAITLLVFLKILRNTGFPLKEVPRRWDGKWYLGIAEHGYDSGIHYLPDGRVAETNLAFFPGLPALIKAVHSVTGLSYQRSALAVSLIAVIVAAIGIHTLVRAVAGNRAGYIAVALWAVLPNATLEWMPYTEALATATTIWALVAVLDQRWLLAGVVTFAAGLVRSTATVLIATICLAAIITIIRRQGGWRVWVGAAIAPGGLVTSWLIIGAYGGKLDAWFTAQQAWAQEFDYGRSAFGSTKEVIYFANSELARQVVPFVLLAALVCVVALCADRRVPWMFIVLVVLTLVLSWGSSAAYASKVRFLLPVAPILLLPFAATLARSKIITVVGVIILMGVLAGWYGVFSLTGTEQAP